MRLGIISDTHDRLPTVRRAVSMFRRLKVDAVLHAGDYVAPFAAKLFTPEHLGPIPLHAIYGNNDGERAGLKVVLPQIVDGPLRIELGSGSGRKTIVMHHFLDWLKPEDIAGADIVISGHDHQANVAQQDGRMLLNPGECCGWLTDRCTVALLDLEKMEAEIVEVHP